MAPSSLLSVIGALHTRVREFGGAYSVGVRTDRSSGYVEFYSGRDSTPERTLNIFEAAGQILDAHLRSMSPAQLELYKISAISECDRNRGDPMVSKATSRFAGMLFNYNYADFGDCRPQKTRDEVFDASVRDLHKIATQLKNAIRAPIAPAFVAVAGSKKSDRKWLKKRAEARGMEFEDDNRYRFRFAISARSRIFWPPPRRAVFTLSVRHKSSPPPTPPPKHAA
eukprot:GHVU01071481.1.p1 GENE.GHVU01071481.1~~GHVU01071481.1.p1  ORF type:complete len:225 (+),score=19.13 GHVU01071481.1:374-1048(+)